jgi:hypothetical protein
VQTKTIKSRNKTALIITGSIFAIGTIFCIFFVLVIVPLLSQSSGRNVETDREQYALSFYEQELIGLWSRYHAYDGSSDYARFNDDRTACTWTEPNNSYFRKSESNFAHWEIDEANPIQEYRFRVIMTYSNSNGSLDEYTFDYPENMIWPDDWQDLKYHPSSEDRTCE